MFNQEKGRRQMNAVAIQRPRARGESNNCTRTYTAADADELLDIVGAGNPDPTNNREVIAFVTLWDGRKITASYPLTKRIPDVETNDPVIYENNVLRPFVDRLLNEEVPIVIKTGTDENECTLVWQFVK